MFVMIGWSVWLVKYISMVILHFQKILSYIKNVRLKRGILKVLLKLLSSIYELYIVNSIVNSTSFSAT